MYSKLKIYSFKGLEVRTVEIDGKPWFVVRDLCAGLEIGRSGTNANDVAKRLLKSSELRKEFIPTTFCRGSLKQNTERKMLLTNESGVYALIMRSNKPEAQEFRFWVTSEVLPSLNNTGSYTMSQKSQEVQSTAGNGMLELPDAMEGVKVSLTLTGEIGQMRGIIGALLGQ